MTSEAGNIVGFYQRHGDTWARERGDRLIETAWLERFTALLPAQAAVLDIGCGSGQPIARYLIGKGYRITGVDSAPGMVALCRGHAPDHEWTVADMRTLSLGRTFAGI